MKSDDITINMNWSGLFTTLLLVLFIALKLTGVIAWSWWWVLSPLWVPLVFVMVVGVFAFFIYSAFMR